MGLGRFGSPGVIEEGLGSSRFAGSLLDELVRVEEGLKVVELVYGREVGELIVERVCEMRFYSDNLWVAYSVVGVRLESLGYPKLFCDWAGLTSKQKAELESGGMGGWEFKSKVGFAGGPRGVLFSMVQLVWVTFRELRWMFQMLT